MTQYSYRRNQQPGQSGKTLRVRSDALVAHPELDFARQAVIKACKRAGNLFAHWRRFTPEWNNGRCPVCYNPRTGSPVDPSCPQCYGTGFDGGFSIPSVQYMTAQHSDRRLEATSGGFTRLLRNMSKSPYLPNIAVGDVIGEVQNIEGEYVVYDRYLIEEGVDPQRFRLSDDLLKPDTFDHLDPQSDVVSYSFEATRIPKHSDPNKRDIKYFLPFENPIWLTTTKDVG
jgi:hypothetical protein